MVHGPYPEPCVDYCNLGVVKPDTAETRKQKMDFEIQVQCGSADFASATRAMLRSMPAKMS